jgi:hypothetical protein
MYKWLYVDMGIKMLVVQSRAQTNVQESKDVARWKTAT